MWLIGWPPNRRIQYLKTVIEWISNLKVQDLRHLLEDDTKTEEGKTILQEQKNPKGALYIITQQVASWNNFCNS